ncbi:hypothetical protein Sjap_008255 [Stephania japonica]|uniref:Uncharacterized protein n=1 Tax=Stephania japonica TaxID=461633 RepID=A0AAP0JP53_9MAGN
MAGTGTKEKKLLELDNAGAAAAATATAAKKANVGDDWVMVDEDDELNNCDVNAAKAQEAKSNKAKTDTFVLVAKPKAAAAKTLEKDMFVLVKGPKKSQSVENYAAEAAAAEAAAGMPIWDSDGSRSAEEKAALADLERWLDAAGAPGQEEKKP